MLLFSTDIDGTIYDGPESARRFADFWNGLRSGPRPPLLAYNTGRSIDDTRALVESTPLPIPDVIVGGVGTEIFDVHADRHLDEWSHELEPNWSFAIVETTIRDLFPGIEKQPDSCQNPFKCSWFWRDCTRVDLDRLHAVLRAAGLHVQIVYSSKRDLDVLPASANKGNAIRWLADQHGISTSDVVVAGDSGNDSSMFLVEGVHGILVANAESALVSVVSGASVHRSVESCAGGVIDGLRRRLRENLTLSPDPE